MHSSGLTTAFELGWGTSVHLSQELVFGSDPEPQSCYPPGNPSELTQCVSLGRHRLNILCEACRVGDSALSLFVFRWALLSPTLAGCAGTVTPGETGSCLEWKNLSYCRMLNPKLKGFRCWGAAVAHVFSSWLCVTPESNLPKLLQINGWWSPMIRSFSSWAL